MSQHPTVVQLKALCTEINLAFSRKLVKYFLHFRMKFALSFDLFDSWYIIKYLLTETLGM